MSGRVLVVGSVNVDIVVGVERHPEPGETVLGTGVHQTYGGKGANQALAAARSGAEVTMIARVGADADGRDYRDRLDQRGIAVDRVLETDGTPTGQAHIRVSADGENSIVVIAGANGELSVEDVQAAADAFDSADVLLAQLEVPADTVVAALKLAAERQVTSILNPSPVTERANELAKLADLVVVNESENDQLSGLDDVVLTLGAEGAVWGDLSAKPPKITVVDTTGAGDTFAGSLAGYLAEGLDRHEALERAVADAAQATTWSGAQPA